MKTFALFMTLFAVSCLIASPVSACGVACGSAVALAAPSYVLAAPAYVAAPQVSVNVPATVGVTCGSAAVAAPNYSLATVPVQSFAVLPSYSFAMATPFVALATPVYSSAVVLSAHVRLHDRLAEHRAVRLNARAEHLAIRAQR